MKVFWAMILVLAVAAGGLLFMRGRDRGAGAAEEARTLSRSNDGGMSPPEVPHSPVAADPAPGGDDAVGGAQPRPDTDAPALAPANASEGLSETGAAVDADVPPVAPAAEAPPIEEEADEAPGTGEDGAGDAGAESAADAAAGSAPVVPTPAPGMEGAPAPMVEETALERPEAPAADAESEPGVLLLNGRHRVTGEGTAAAPYVVSWDTLVALESEYEPKTEGKKQVPAWIKALDGRHVSITGFIAFPFIAPSAEECMVMLNQWDGCCIGVPPTPYDAVEVKLAEAIDLQQGVVNYGTITGVFRTDPYLVNGWLIGLYVMEDAKLTDAGGKNSGGF
ncbi:MAG TPA: hypothetical protein VFF69_13990 [Phycisphaerales bacterium]|nr:hypothetical protein [Phycisphaerales bacterium]